MLRTLPAHANVVRLLDFFRSRSSGRVYLVFDYMERNLLEVGAVGKPGRAQAAATAARQQIPRVDPECLQQRTGSHSYAQQVCAAMHLPALQHYQEMPHVTVMVHDAVYVISMSVRQLC